jgi:predicted acylesterase/phospholipase RssA
MVTSTASAVAERRILHGLRPRREGTVSILSLDGGGMRGLVPARILDELEARAGLPIWRMFDLVAGTSTGGLIALALVVPGAGNGVARYRPADLLALYREQGQVIFPRSLLRGIWTAGGLLRPRYPAGPIERVLWEFFGETHLHEALTPVMVTSYDAAAAGPHFFKSYRPHEALAGEPAAVRFRGDHLVWRAARATSAAPTYFPPALLREHGPGGGERCLLDGGVFANNPSMCALADAYFMYGGRPLRSLVVSIGTGADDVKQSDVQVRRRGILGWARPILRTVLDGVADSVEYEAREMADEFHRFQHHGPAPALDDASPAAIRRCEEAAEAVIERQGIELDALAARLRANAPGTRAPRGMRPWPARASPAQSMPAPSRIPRGEETRNDPKDVA